MTALARMVERMLAILLKGGSGPGRMKRIASVLGAALVVAAAVWVSYLRIAYQLSLGP